MSADFLSPAERSRQMALVRSADTKPEMLVRRLVHGMGYRYRLHDRSLPGCPDLVFASRRKVIFVHGCFWHWHNCKRGRRMPQNRRDYWQAKLLGNRRRDARHRRELRRLGWSVLTVWECQLKPAKLPRTMERIAEFLE